MSNNKPLSTHPAHIYRPHNDYLKSDNEAERHKSLLDMGESFLTYLVGIMFGEFGAKYPEGTLFRPTKEENQNWRLYAKDELGVESNYLYDMIHSKYRFKGRGLPREEVS